MKREIQKKKKEYTKYRNAKWLFVCIHIVFFDVWAVIFALFIVVTNLLIATGDSEETHETMIEVHPDFLVTSVSVSQSLLDFVRHLEIDIIIAIIPLITLSERLCTTSHSNTINSHAIHDTHFLLPQLKLNRNEKKQQPQQHLIIDVVFVCRFNHDLIKHA